MKRKELEWKDEKEMKKEEWDGDEDAKLLLPKLDGRLRCGKSCRGRWSNCLRSGINRCAFTSEEENLVIHLHAILGNRWSFIAEHLPGRTVDDIKNVCNVRLKKRVLSRVSTSLDPQIHEQAMTRLLTKSSLYSLSRNSEPDIFLRLWNSPVGESFRNFNPKGKAKCQNFDSQLSPFLNCASGSGLTMNTFLESEATEFKVPITVAEGMNSGLNSNSWSKKKDPSTMKMLELLCSNEVSFLEDYVDDHSIFLNH